MRTFRTGALCSLTLAVSVSIASQAWSQEKVGVVTAVAGPVTVARTSTPPEPLKFKDPIYLRDLVTTGDNAITRILLGGKVIVTARERSTLTITEVPGLSTIDLTGGRIAVAVDKTKMKPGERVDIRTPNAIAGVRGTVLIVEVHRNTSTVTVLRGLVDVVRIDPKTGRAVGPVTPVAAHQVVSVRGTTLPARPQPISSIRAAQLSKEFTPPVRRIAAGAVMPVQDEVDRATTLLNAMLPSAAPASGRQTATASGSINGPGDAPSAVDQTSRPVLNTATGVTAPTLSSSAPALTTSTPTLTSTAPTLTSTVPTVTSTLTTVTTPVLATTTTLVPALVPTTPVVPTTALTPPPPSSSQGLLGGLLTPVTGLLK